MIRVSFNPLKTRLHSTRIPLSNLRQHILHNILILDGFTGRRLPSVPSPIFEPDGDAVDGVFGVGYYDDVAVAGGDFECAEDGG